MLRPTEFFTGVSFLSLMNFSSSHAEEGFPSSEERIHSSHATEMLRMSGLPLLSPPRFSYSRAIN